MYISCLDEVPWFQDNVVDCIWREWHSDFIKLTKHKSKELLKCHLCSGIPNIYVMYDQNGFIATCIVDVEDLPLHQELHPWLAYVYVDASKRKKGYGTQLIKHVCNLYPKLYLLSFSRELVEYYTRLGFVIFDEVKDWGGHSQVACMKWHTHDLCQ